MITSTARPSRPPAAAVWLHWTPSDSWRVEPTPSTVRSFSEIPAADWNRLQGTRRPFLRHEFFHALEREGCLEAAGWEPRIVVVPGGNGTVQGALVLFLKHDSWGEFVFDQGWAAGAARAGIPYYPKLVATTPYTPVVGARFLLAPAADAEALRHELLQGALDLAEAEGAQSLHFLFLDSQERAALSERGFLLRTDCRFEWHDRGYENFSEFLARFRSTQRKKVRSERNRVREAGIELEWIEHDALRDAPWAAIHDFYASTYRRHGMLPYFPAGLFVRFAASMPDAMKVVLARRSGIPVAAAIFFADDDALYGRYWGADGDYDGLHFEACYFQGIEYCLHHGLKRFDPGTQGEHKLRRGFEPTTTWSAHWFRHRGLHDGVRAYLEEERPAVGAYLREARRHLPFHRCAG